MLDALALGVVIPVMPRLIADIAHVEVADTDQFVALFGSTWALMQLLASPVQGALSDRYGRRPVILISNCGMGLNYMLMALAPNLTLLWIGRLISGVCAGSIPAAMAYLADINPPERRAAGFGVLGAGFSVGFMIGPGLGGLLGQLDPRAPFWAAAGLSLLNFLYGMFVLPESLPRDRRAPIQLWRLNPVGALVGLARSYPPLIGMLAVSFLLAFAQLGPNNVYVLYTNKWYGWGPANVGMFMTAGAVAGMVVQGLLVGQAAKRLGERLCLVAGSVLMIAGLSIYGLAATGTAFWFGIPFTSLGAIGGPAWSALMSRQVGPSEQGRLAGASACLTSLSSILTPVLFIACYHETKRPQSFLPPGSPFFMAALVLALGVGLAVWVTRRGAGAPAAAAAAEA